MSGVFPPTFFSDIIKKKRRKGDVQMETKLAENIRTFRKERALTQEQLAEVLGVTVGAVYKWEAKLSQPELTMIMTMADFFDTSVDVLLGYEMKDNRRQATVDRLKKYYHDKDREGLREAEKALKKYPNDFNIVYSSATLYRLFGFEGREKALQRRALELLEYARMLLPQNTDPEISELTIYGNMAEGYLDLGEADRAVELWKKHNAGGIYSDRIGLVLAADCGRGEEALPFLSESLLKNTVSIIHTVMGYINVFFDQKNYDCAREILLWSVGLLSGLKDGDRPDAFDKVHAAFFVFLGYTRIKSGDIDAARQDLSRAKKLAERFDDVPDYSMEAIRFVSLGKRACAYDDIGETAMSGIQNALDSLGDGDLSALWKEISGHEE